MGESQPVDPHAGDGSNHSLTAPSWRCRLDPGARLRSVEGRTFLVRERPLAVVDVRARAARLLAGLPPGKEVVLAPPPPAEQRFLRRLADLGLLELRPARDGAPWPSVSVIVPVRDRGRQLAACLRSLSRLRYPPERLRLLVVDDASARPVVVPQGVGVLRLPRPAGPAAARNRGASASRSELLAFVDSDCVVEPGWLEALVPELADPAVAAAGGRVLPAAEGSWLERYEAVRSPLDLGSVRVAVRPRQPVPYLVTANLVVRREAFTAVGGFDAGLRTGEDVDLCWRLSTAGHRLVYQPEGRVRHEHRGAPRAFVATRAAYAISEASLLRRHPGNGRWLGFSPGMGAFALGMAGALLGRRRLPAAGTLALAVEVATAAGRLRPLGLARRRSAAAILSGQATGLYHAARQLTRYYGLPAAAVALALALAPRGPGRRLLAGLAAAELATAIADWRRLRPRMSLPAFVGAQLLDDAAYQCGVLLGCLRQRSFAPLAVELRLMGGRNPDP